MVRRLVAVGAGIVLFLLLVFGFRACLNSRKDTAYRDYTRELSALVQESNSEGQALFKLLAVPDRTSDVAVENQLNTFSGQAGQLVERVSDIDHPGELNGAQRAAVDTFRFRRDGVAAIARQLPKAIADRGDRKQGTEQIAASMQNFLTSDVIFQTRVVPALRSKLEGQDLGAEQLPRSRFLPDVEWLQPSVVGDRVGKLGGSGTDDKDAAPGLHGTGVAAATIGGQALSPGASANVSATGDLSLSVQVANQGDNEESDVKVSVTIGRGTDAIKAEKVLDTIAAGETKTVEVPITSRPPTGQNVPIQVEVSKVPGEQKLDNNKQSYSAIFTS